MPGYDDEGPQLGGEFPNEYVDRADFDAAIEIIKISLSIHFDALNKNYVENNDELKKGILDGLKQVKITFDAVFECIEANERAIKYLAKEIDSLKVRR